MTSRSIYDMPRDLGVGAPSSEDVTRDYSHNLTENAIRYGSRALGALLTVVTVKSILSSIPYLNEDVLPHGEATITEAIGWGASLLVSLIPIPTVSNRTLIGHVTSAFGSIGDGLARRLQARRLHHSTRSLEANIKSSKKDDEFTHHIDF